MTTTAHPPTAARRSARWGAILACALACLLGGAAEAGEVFAALKPDTIRLGQRTTLELSFVNCQPTTPPQLPAVAGLSFDFIGRATSVNIVNGQQTTTLTLRYAVTPDRAGDFDIPAVRAEVNGQTLSTSPVKLKVLRPDENAPAAAEQNQLAFLRLTPAKEEVFIGEVLPVDTQVFYVNAQDIQIQPLTGDGFTFGKTAMLPQGQTQVGNQLYAVGGTRTTAVASKVGELTLGPAECRLNLRVRSERRRTNDPFFDSFFDEAFGGRFELRPARLVSPPRTIRVLPLPEAGKPEDFAGAVGQYSLAVTVSPTNVAVGEPITITVRVSGRGLLENIKLPSLDRWQDFRVYPPTSEVETADVLGIEGTKVFQQVVVPESLDIAAVPPLSFSYFDPAARAYRTLQHPATPLIVRPAASPAGLAPLVPAVPGAAPTPAASDLVPLKVRGSPWAVITPPLVQRPWFLLVQAIPVGAFLAAWCWRRRNEALARNPRLLRRRAVARLTRELMPRLNQLAEAGDSEEFHAVLFRLLQEHIGERVDQPAASITESVVDDQLKPRGLAADSLADLHHLFQACNQARYAPAASRADLMNLRAKLESALAALQRLKE
ncbi:MAG: protein BatD [Verrucomicrobia bacterium]|nr:protein BatD [Verrucomicrobiota bacterium]